MTTFHDRISQLYEEFKDTHPNGGRTAFAEACDVTYGQASGWLSRRGEPKSEVMKSVAAKFNVSIGWLTGETDIRNYENFTFLRNLPPAAVNEIHEYLEFIKFKYKLKTKKD